MIIVSKRQSNAQAAAKGRLSTIRKLRIMAGFAFLGAALANLVFGHDTPTGLIMQSGGAIAGAALAKIHLV